MGRKREKGERKVGGEERIGERRSYKLRRQGSFLFLTTTTTTMVTSAIIGCCRERMMMSEPYCT
jgi:hypothetical protein